METSYNNLGPKWEEVSECLQYLVVDQNKSMCRPCKGYQTFILKKSFQRLHLFNNFQHLSAHFIISFSCTPSPPPPPPLPT